MSLKICYIISDISVSHHFEAMCRYVARAGFEVSVIFVAENPPQLYQKFLAEGFTVEYIKLGGKASLLPITGKIFNLLGKFKPDVVHTHLFNAAFTGLIAAHLRRVKKKIQSRHHGNECHLYYPRGIYYDRFLHTLSDHIVANSEMVANILTEKEAVRPDKVSVIHYGFELEKFSAAPETVAGLKKKYDLEDNFPVVGVISRFVHWKGVHDIVPAFGKLSRQYPKAKFVFANAFGDYAGEIQKLLDEHLPDKNYVLIDFETEVFALYKTFDVFVHTPINLEVEAFGQIYVEPMLLEVPSVFTMSGVASEFVEDGQNALVVPHGDSEAIFRAVSAYLEDADLRKKIIDRGKQDATRLFAIDTAVEKLKRLYLNL